jgi:Mrp family chromosome partitioning ATPase
MNNTSALGAARSRWWVIALFTAIGAGLGAVPAPARVSEASQATRYAATHTMVINDTEAAFSNSTVVSPNQVVLLSTTGDVPQRVADKLGFGGNSAELASLVTVSFDPSSGALTFSTVQPDAQQAELLANTFAEEANSHLVERQDLIYEDRLAKSLSRLEELETQLDELTQQLATRPDDATLLAQRDAVSRQYGVAFEQNDALSTDPAVLSFSTLERAQAVAIQDQGLSAPQSRTTRGALGAVVGGVVGLGVALLLGRLDRKVRTREQAESVTGLRARVIIPKASDDKHAQAVVASGRHDALSDAYRTLRNVVGFVQGSMPASDKARITLVVSPGPGEGKTTLVSNLAATFAETGQRTIAVNTDFRRPQLGVRLTDNPWEPMPYILEDLAWVEPDQLLKPTRVPNLSMLDLAGLGSPDELARVTASLLPRLSTVADAIVIDSSPVTATAEVLELVPLADLIVVVVRMNRTQIESAERTIAILRDLTTVPLLLVLSGMKQERTHYYYDYSDRRSKASEPKRVKPTRRITDATPRPAARPPSNGAAAQLNLDEIDEFLRQQPPRPDR